jgi:hypothetical protein
MRALSARLPASLATLTTVALADIGFVHGCRFANPGRRARLSRRIPK